MLAFFEVGQAPVVVGQGIFRVQRDGLIKVGDGAVEIALIAVGVAAVVVGDGKVRIERAFGFFIFLVYGLVSRICAAEKSGGRILSGPFFAAAANRQISICRAPCRRWQGCLI